MKDKRRLSVPRSVSPKKNLISGPPRRSGRSLGPPSSPSQQLVNGTPSHVPLTQLEETPIKEPKKRASLGRPKKVRKSGVTAKKDRKKGPFDLSASEDEPESTIDASIDPSLSLINGATTDDFVPQVADESIEENLLQPEESEQPTDIPAEDTQEPEAEAEAEADTTTASLLPIPFPKGHTMSMKPDPVANESKKRGRPARKPQVLEDDRDLPPRELPKPGRGKRKAPLTEQDPNVKIRKIKQDSVKPPSRAGSVQPSSNFVRRSETPATDSGALMTRSGRTSIKPVAFWRGENIIYGERRSRDSLPGILEVVRTEEMPPPPRRRPGGGAQRTKSRRGRAGTAQPLSEDEDDNDELEPWEEDPGIQHAIIMAWNDETGKYDEDTTEPQGM